MLILLYQMPLSWIMQQKKSHSFQHALILFKPQHGRLCTRRHVFKNFIPHQLVAH